MKKLQSNTPSSSNFKELWVSAMLDDFNTAKAFGFYFKFINDGKLSNKSEIRNLRNKNKILTDELNDLRNVAVDEGIYDSDDEGY